MAIQAANNNFVAVDPEDDAVVALKKNVGEAEIAVIRACAEREKSNVSDVPEDEQGDLKQVEINYVYVS